MKNIAIALLVPLLILTSCATGHQATSEELRKLVSANQFDQAITVLNQSSLKEDQKSQLLYFIELGLLEHFKANYVESSKSFNQAKNLADELYTTHLSGKVSSVFGNDNSDYYYGEKYETSLIYFYLALNHYLQADQEIDPVKKKTFLLEARAEILSWDSFLTEMKNDRLGQALFKEDLLAKTFGALIHEAQGTMADDQIALQLYKDANEVFFKNYNLFPTFNQNFRSFKENFSLLPKLSRKEIEGKYVLSTEHTSAFKSFLTLKILILTKKIRPYDFKNQVAKLKPSSKILTKFSGSRGNITFLIQDGLVVEKIAKKYEYPIHLDGKFGLAYTLGVSNKISFELPYVETPPTLQLAKLQALDLAGNVIDEAPLSVIAPLGELAEQAINEHSTRIAAKTGARVAAKHIAALLATQLAYNAAKNRNPTFALMAATLGHAAAVAAINESEKADTRFWSTLPSNIRMGNLSLPNGTYKFQVVYGMEGSSDYRIKELGLKEVGKGILRFAMVHQHADKIRNMAKTPTPVDQKNGRDVSSVIQTKN